MAAQSSPYTWPFLSSSSSSTSTTTTKCPSSSTSSNLSSFLTKHRRRFTSCSSSSPGSSAAKPAPKAPPNLHVTIPATTPSLKNRSGGEKTIIPLTSNPRSLWKRIFFASKKVRSILLLNVITVVYASNFSIVKEVEAVIDPAAFTVVRFAMSAVPFVPFVVRARGDVETRNAGFELGVWVSLGYLMQALGLMTSDAGRASFLSMFTVIIVPLLDGMLGVKVPARVWIGALVSIVGVGLLESSGSPPSVRDFLNFLSAVFFGVHMLRTEHISRNTKKENFLPLLGYEICVVAFLSTIWYLIGAWSGGGLQDFNPSSWKWEIFWQWMVVFPWIPALYTGIFSTVLCLWVEMAAMSNVSATETAIIYGLEPVWGACFAWFFLGERWGSTGWIGAALVLGGSLTVQIFGSTSSTSPTEPLIDETKANKLTFPMVSDKHNGLSASPIVVSSRKETPDLRNK